MFGLFIMTLFIIALVVIQVILLNDKMKVDATSVIIVTFLIMFMTFFTTAELIEILLKKEAVKHKAGYYQTTIDETTGRVINRKWKWGNKPNEVNEPNETNKPNEVNEPNEDTK
jgi:hypothetical protein